MSPGARLCLLCIKYRILPRQSAVEKKAVEERVDDQGSSAFPTTQQFLEGILHEIVGQLKWQHRQGTHAMQQELLESMASTLIARSWDEKNKEGEFCENQSESGRLQKDEKAARPETPPQPREPLPPEIFGDDEPGEVVVA